MRVAYIAPYSGQLCLNSVQSFEILVWLLGSSSMFLNKAETIAAALQRVIRSRSYDRTTARNALQTYGSEAVSRSLDKLHTKVMTAQMEKGRSQFGSCGTKSAILAYDQLP